MELDVLDLIFTDGIMSGIGYLPIALFLIAFALVAVLVLVVRIELVYAIPVAALPFTILLFYNYISVPYLTGGITLLFGFLLAFALYSIFIRK
jgi:hypothetical protein